VDLYRWMLDDRLQHCPYCAERAGEIKTLVEWEIVGKPPVHNGCGCWLAREIDELPQEVQMQSVTQENQRQKFSISATPRADGEFDVIAMTAGIGNGWEFGADVLRASLALWDGVDVFVDHSHIVGDPRSVRDLGGVVYNPTWDESAQGIVARLRPMGPSAALVRELGREMLAEGEPKPRVGFSADVGFTADGLRVLEILRPYALDLVYDPARGGAFIRALNAVGASHTGRAAIEKEGKMPDEKNLGSAPASTAKSDLDAVRELLSVQQEKVKLAREAEEAVKVRAQMCAYLLDSGLAASGLPAPMQAHVREQFAGKVFEPQELTNALDGARKLVSDLTASQTVRGVSGVRAMFDSRDQIQAAVDDLLDAPRDDALKALQVHRLSGIRELYHMLTGDFDLHGGYYPDRARFATTADFTGLVKNALNKIVVNQWQKLGRAGYDWWERVATKEHFNSLNGITGTLIGTVGQLPSVAEGAEYAELVIGDSPETASFVKYGGYIPLTLELIDRDETRKLKAYPRELANAGLRRISGLVAAIFTDNAGVGPTLADTGALFNATVVTTAGGHANLLTTALSSAQWETVSAAVYNQPMLIANAAGLYGTGPKQAINPKYCLVPRALSLTAKKIFNPTWENAANIHSENQQRDTDAVVVVPEWTDATDWAAVCDPTIAPAIFVGERFGIMPEVFIAGDELSPAVFMNDEHRLKVRHFVAVWVNDFRPLHKSNV
jgi:hypothetical protein